LLYENDETCREFDRLTMDAGFTPKVQEYYNVETMLELAELGYGILYMNELYAYNHNRTAKEKPLEFFLTGRQDNRVEVYLSYHKRILEQEYGKMFLDMIRNSAM